MAVIVEKQAVGVIEHVELDLNFLAKHSWESQRLPTALTSSNRVHKAEVLVKL